MMACVRPDKERKYSVIGSHIIFSLWEPNSVEKRPDFDEALDTISAMYPWRDGSESGGYLQPYQPSFSQNCSLTSHYGTDGQWVFQIAPINHLLSRGQLLAFEKFMEKLASELALLRLVNVTEVKGVLKVELQKSFACYPFNLHK